MNDARTCYRKYIESDEYVENDGWRSQLDAAFEQICCFIDPSNKRAMLDIENALTGYACSAESRSFAAGFNAATRLWAIRLMESNQWSMTE